MGFVGQPCKKIIHPHATYKKWFENVGFDLVSENAIQEKPEEFFQQTPSLCQRIKNNWKDSMDPELANGNNFPTHQMSLSFIDYQLRNP